MMAMMWDKPGKAMCLVLPPVASFLGDSTSGYWVDGYGCGYCCFTTQVSRRTTTCCFGWRCWMISQLSALSVWTRYYVVVDETIVF